MDNEGDEIVDTEAKDAAAEAAADAAAQTQEVIEGASEIAAAEIENAQERVDAAERRAQEVTDAALATALGRQISTLQQDMETWRNQNQANPELLQQMATRLEALESRIPAQPPAPENPAPPESSQTEQSSSTPEILAEAVDQTLESQTEIIPGGENRDQTEESPAADEPRKPQRRWT